MCDHIYMLYLLDKKNSHIQNTQCDSCVKKIISSLIKLCSSSNFQIMVIVDNMIIIVVECLKKVRAKRWYEFNILYVYICNK